MKELQPTRTAIFLQKVSDCIGKNSVSVSREVPIIDVVELMNKENVSSVLVQEEGAILGIITESDIARRVAFQVDKTVPVSELMTTQVATVKSTDYLYKAVGLMLNHNLRHLPVLDATNNVCGVVRMRDAFFLANHRALDEVRTLTQDDSLEGLTQIKQAQFELVSNLKLEGLSSHQIQAVIGQLNNDIHRYALQNAFQQMKEEGWGEVPTNYALLVLGSVARGESFFSPDQDNAMIFEMSPDLDQRKVDAWYIALSEKLTYILDKAGFDLCTGNIMVTNPQWRKPFNEWIVQMESWFSRKTKYAERYVDIFFDFSCIAGDHELAEKLRKKMLAMCRQYPSFLRELLAYDQSGTELTFWGGLKGESFSGPRKGQLSLKYAVMAPMTRLLRLLCLKHGVQSISNLQRLDELTSLGVLDSSLAYSLRMAFIHTCDLLFDRQIKAYQSGEKITNYVILKSLNMKEEALLVQAVKAIKELRLRTQEMITGRLM